MGPSLRAKAMIKNGRYESGHGTKGLRLDKRMGSRPTKSSEFGICWQAARPVSQRSGSFLGGYRYLLQGPEILNLTVTDVRRSDGNVRSVIEVARRRGKPPLGSALSKVLANALRKWINKAGKKRTAYIFSGRGNNRSFHPMTVRQISRLLRDWVSDAGLDP